MDRLTPYLQKLTRLLSYGDRLRPVRDWVAIALIALVLLVASAGWSYFLFSRVSNDELNPAGAAPVPTVSTSSLDTVMQIFSQRTAMRTHYLTDYHFVDPSR